MRDFIYCLLALKGFPLEFMLFSVNGLRVNGSNKHRNGSTSGLLDEHGDM